MERFPRHRPFVRGSHQWQRAGDAEIFPFDDGDAKLWRFVWSAQRLCKQSRRWWFETPSRSLWRHCNESDTDLLSIGARRITYRKFKLNYSNMHSKFVWKCHLQNGVHFFFRLQLVKKHEVLINRCSRVLESWGAFQKHLWALNSKSS